MNPRDEINSSFKSLVPHFQELKTRISKCLLFVLAFFIVLFPFSDIIYTQLAEPLISRLPEGSNMIAIDVASPFFIPFKLVMILSIFYLYLFFYTIYGCLLLLVFMKKKESSYYQFLYLAVYYFIWVLLLHILLFSH